MEHSVHLSSEVEELVRALAEGRDGPEPDPLGWLGHLPDVLRDALAIGLEQLAVEQGLIGPRPPAGPPAAGLGERDVRVQLRLPDAAVTSVVVFAPACVELRTDSGDAVAFERRTLERVLAIVEHEDGRRP